MRIWFDTEFLDNGRTVDLISVGMVREDGAEYYAETQNAYDLCAQNEWLAINVLPHLRGPFAPSSKRRAQIATEIMGFAGENPVFWGYCSAYDWVCLCQLYGRMIDMPQNWPYFCRDIAQLAGRAGLHDVLKPHEPQHNALVDAKWTRDLHKLLAP